MKQIMKPFDYIFYRYYKYYIKKKNAIPFMESALTVAFEIAWLTSGLWGILVRVMTTHDIVLIHYYGTRQIHLSSVIIFLIFSIPIYRYYKRKKDEIMNTFTDSRFNTIPFWLFVFLHVTAVFVLGIFGIVYMHRFVETYNLEGILERWLL